jgi:hypothetical protein
MNKQEYKKQYRIARAAISSINRSVVSRGLSQDEAEAVWGVFWHGIHQKLPAVIYNAAMKPDRKEWHAHWPIKDKYDIRCNLRLLRNSYPRTDVRNTGCV